MRPGGDLILRQSSGRCKASFWNDGGGAARSFSSGERFGANKAYLLEWRANRGKIIMPKDGSLSNEKTRSLFGITCS